MTRGAGVGAIVASWGEGMAVVEGTGTSARWVSVWGMMLSTACSVGDSGMGQRRGL